MSFETRLERLEKISADIRDGEIDLDSAVKLFEEGMKLAMGLEKELAKIERKVQILVNEPTADGEDPNLELFPDLDNSASSPPPGAPPSGQSPAGSST